MEAAFIKCIQEIPNDDYTAQKVENCVGTDSEFIVNDFDYLSKTVKAQYISKLT